MGAASSNLANDIVIVGYVMYICASVLYVVNASQPWSNVITDETNASVRLQPLQRGVVECIYPLYA